jgi:putative membrane protein
MWWSLLLQIGSGILGLWLAQRYVPGVTFTGSLFVLPKDAASFSAFLSSLTFAGILLGFLNAIVKPLLKKITFPLRIITLNLFSFVIAMAMVWVVDIITPELTIQGLKALFFTTLIVWAIHFLLSSWMPDSDRIFGKRQPAYPSNGQ